MTPPHAPRVLCVDDEPAVLEGLRDRLRRSFDIRTAVDGRTALALLKADPEGYAVVICDMRMPGMSGAVVLREAQRIAPTAVRILLTGYADADSAIRAVNDGQIFRFLAKPCQGEELQHACAAAVGRHRMLVAERRVLEHAQYEMIDALAGLLAAALPANFAPGVELERDVAALARAAGLRESRELQLAAKLIALAPAALPAGTAERLPELARVSEIIRTSARRFDSIEQEGPLSEAAQLLRIVVDAAEGTLGCEPGVYNPSLLAAYERSCI